MNNSYNDLTAYREGMYLFLAAVYLEEVDTEMLQVLLHSAFPVFDEPKTSCEQDLDAGYRLIEKGLSVFEGKTEAETKALLEDLAADYAKTFLAAGDATGKAAFPYESIYTGTDSAFVGSLQQNLASIYAAKGLSMSEEMFKVMEDHIGLELEFMAMLVNEGAPPEEQKTFFQDHIINWALLFTADVYKYSERDFYKGIARITSGFLEAEQEYFQE